MSQMKKNTIRCQQARKANVVEALGTDFRSSPGAKGEFQFPPVGHLRHRVGGHPVPKAALGTG